MTFYEEAGVVRFRNAAGTETLNSDEKQVVISQYVEASFVLASINNSSSSSPVIRTDTITLASGLHASATAIEGWHESFGQVRSLGGTRLHYARTEHLDPTGVYRYYLTGSSPTASAVWFHFTVAGGVLQVIVNYRFPAGAQVPFTGTTVKVYAWVFTTDN